MTTLHVSNLNPVIAAKTLTTIDHISGGRFGLNIVCGWFKEESEMCGNVFLPHDERYDYADEWITAIKRLWVEDDEIDFDGRYIQIKGGMSQPKPVQRPRPVLMNAGSSEAGRAFVAKHCDLAFVRVSTFEDMKREAAEYRRAAYEHDGRRLQIWIIGAIVQGDTDRDAQKRADFYAEHVDESYLDSYFDYKKPGLTPAARKDLMRKYAFAGNGLPLIGSAESIAAQLENLSREGIDGVLLTWVDYQTGVRWFGEQVLPLLAQSGVRAPL
jgi:alkanesulfonate monooxygenase SsuD/methylene tetrahydromethanopterin reductase-like flavin-dependent oxidoreductase (luciferase family)